MRSLVIGGAGAIGSHVVDQLISLGHDIIVLDNFSNGNLKNLEKSKDEIKFVLKADIKNQKEIDYLFKKVDYVFLLAASRILDTMNDPRKALENNVLGTFNVLESCVKHKINKVIYSSSSSVFGDPIFLPVRENHPFQTNSPYAASKIAAEQFCNTMHQVYDLKIIGLRYFNVYGPRQDYKGIFTTIIPKWLDCIDNCLPIEIHGDGSQTMDLIYIEDVARSNICAMNSSIDYGFYNIGTGVETSVNSLANILLSIYNKTAVIKHNNVGINLVKRRKSSTILAEQKLNFKSEVPLIDGLMRLIKWRQNSKSPCANPISVEEPSST